MAPRSLRSVLLELRCGAMLFLATGCVGGCASEVMDDEGRWRLDDASAEDAGRDASDSGRADGLVVGSDSQMTLRDARLAMEAGVGEDARAEDAQLDPCAAGVRECVPGSLETMGTGCDEQVRACDGQSCTWGAYQRVMQCPKLHVVFVNFDGQKVDDCPNFCEEPQSNRTWIVGDSYGGSASSWTFPPFTRGRAARDEILNKLSRYYARYNIVFEETRPLTGPYTMVVVSDAHLLPNHGVCPLDCQNASEQLCLVNKTDDDQVDTVARYVAHELGHSFGLHHVSSSADIMVWNSAGSSFTASSLEQDACGKSKGAVQDAPAVLANNLGLRAEENVGASCYVSGARGSCIDENVTSCAGTIHSGACPGPAQVRCCVP